MIMAILRYLSLCLVLPCFWFATTVWMFPEVFVTIPTDPQLQIYYAGGSALVVLVSLYLGIVFLVFGLEE